MKSNFNEKKEARKQRYEELAEKNESKAEQHFEASNRAVDGIPMGQPILVGHHSEKSHRNALKRSHNHMDKMVESNAKSKYYAGRAQAVENDRNIYSDDPEAVIKLKEKLADLESKRDKMKAMNKIFRNKKLTEDEKFEQLEKDYGIARSVFDLMLNPPYSYQKPGFQPYELTNLGATIRNTAKRLEQLQREESAESIDCTFEGGKLVDSKEDNRFQFFFDDKPSEEIRTLLKRNGFKWSRYVGAWMRHRNNAGRYAVKTVLEKLNEANL